VRQLLSEVTERPTMDVVVVDTNEIKSALFADTEHDRLVFRTDASVGLYSLRQKQFVFIKKLRPLGHMCSLQGLAVNPHLGTIAVGLAVSEVQSEAALQQQLRLAPRRQAALRGQLHPMPVVVVFPLVLLA